MKLKSFTISVFISFICFLSGDNTSISNIDIKGNDNISDQVLLFILRQKSPNIFFRRPNFNPRLLKLDALTIKNYYHSKGFLDVNVIDIFEETSTLIEKFKGGPVGINTLSTAVSESAETIEEVYEPFLIQQGFIVRTPRGREVTKLAYDHLGLKKSQSQNELF